MNNPAKVERLERLRRGFDLTIEQLYAEKNRKGFPVVVAAPDGMPVPIPARDALDRFHRWCAVRTDTIVSES